MTPFQLDFKYVQDDYLDFLDFYLTTVRRKQNLIAAGIIIGSLLIIAVIQAKSDMKVLLGYIGMIAVFGVFWWFLFRWMLKRNGAKAAKAMPQFWEARTVTVDEQGLKVKGETFAADYTWAELVRFDETKANFLLFSSPYSALIIPKRVCTADQVAALQGKKGVF